MVALQLTGATLLPILISGLFSLLEKKTRFSSCNKCLKQVIIGVTFGAFAILSTEFGVPAGDGTVMNVRDSAPLCAGLIFGAPAGFIAGTIGGLHRWLCVYWGGGMVTRVACSLATFLAGIFSGLMRRQLFEGKKPSFLSGFGIGTTMEVLHMLLLLSTNLHNVSYAFKFVQICAFPMILCNGIAVSFSILISGFTVRKEKIDIKSKHISYDFGFWLLVCVIIAFLVTSSFTQQIVYRITTDDAELYRYVTLYLVAFMEILIYTALFILIYQMLKKKIICNLQKINEGLNEITKGNLDTVINVRSHKEFSELSDDVNATVDTLKRYINEAEERIDKELEFARQIQHSALPSIFPPYPNRSDFDLFASMDAAKEVGGDFYDFYLLNRNTLVMLIADVSGKGIPAAMFMMTAKTMIKGLVESGKDIDTAFNIANKKLCENNEAGMFITAWIGKLNLSTGKLSFVNAGHNPPLICHSGGSFEYLRTKPNFILAGMNITKYKTQEIMLSPGDCLYLYTDGVTETSDKEKQLYGEQRLQKHLSSVAEKSPKEICASTKDNLLTFAAGAPQSDDITMLCVRLNALQRKNSITIHPDISSLALVSEYLNDRLKSAGATAKLINRVQVAVDEILSNIIHYSDAQMVEVSYDFNNDSLQLTFRDNGKEYDPTKAKNPETDLSLDEREIGGLGIYMVRKLTSLMTYERNDYNVLTLQFSQGGTDP